MIYIHKAISCTGFQIIFLKKCLRVKKKKKWSYVDLFKVQNTSQIVHSVCAKKLKKKFDNFLLGPKLLLFVKYFIQTINRFHFGA